MNYIFLLCLICFLSAVYCRPHEKKHRASLYDDFQISNSGSWSPLRSFHHLEDDKGKLSNVQRRGGSDVFHGIHTETYATSSELEEQTKKGNDDLDNHSVWEDDDRQRFKPVKSSRVSLTNDKSVEEKVNTATSEEKKHTKTKDDSSDKKDKSEEHTNELHKTDLTEHTTDDRKEKQKSQVKEEDKKTEDKQEEKTTQDKQEDNTKYKKEEGSTKDKTKNKIARKVIKDKENKQQNNNSDQKESDTMVTSKWNQKMQQYINEIYGGQLPYSPKEVAEKNKQSDTEVGTKSDMVKMDKENVKTDESVLNKDLVDSPKNDDQFSFETSNQNGDKSVEEASEDNMYDIAYDNDDGKTELSTDTNDKSDGISKENDQLVDASSQEEDLSQSMESTLTSGSEKISRGTENTEIALNMMKAEKTVNPTPFVVKGLTVKGDNYDSDAPSSDQMKIDMDSSEQTGSDTLQDIDDNHLKTTMDREKDDTLNFKSQDMHLNVLDKEEDKNLHKKNNYIKNTPVYEKTKILETQTVHDNLQYSEKEESKVILHDITKSTRRTSTAAPSTRPNPPTTILTDVTHVSKAKNDDVKAYQVSKPYATCENDGNCPPGRICHQRTCVCGDESLCVKHRKPVCGSDGILYQSHCELHRTACITGNHIKVDSLVTCKRNMNKATIPVNKTIRAQNCDFKLVQFSTDPIFAMCDVVVKTYREFSDCQASCKDCKAFTYNTHGGVCELFYDDLCVTMLNDQGKTHYLRDCHGEDKHCQIMQIIPGHSPYMCSKATVKASNMIECHDTCIRGHCEAFRYRRGGFCEIFFDKSCVAMLEKGKDNYYVRRCTNPADCKYEEVESAGNTPCDILSRTLDTFKACRDACDDCVAFKYILNTGECSIYQQESCITKQNINFIRRNCSPSNQTAQETIQQKIPTTLPVVSEKIKISATKNPSYEDNQSVKSEHTIIRDQGQRIKGQGQSENLVTQQNTPKVNMKTAAPVQIVVTSPQTDTDVKNGGLKDVNNMQNEDGSSDVNMDRSEPADDLNPQDGNQNREPEIVIGGQHILTAETEENPLFTEICTKQEYVRMKADILRYHCVRFGEKDCGTNILPKKGYTSALMFSYYDRNMDGFVQRDELWQIWVIEKFEKMFPSCSLLDLFKFEESFDGKINREQFIQIFDIPADDLKEEIHVIHTMSTVGNGLEIRCGIQPSSEKSQVIWERHSINLEKINFPDVAVFSDGTLYFETVKIHHIGNWTCHDRDKPGVKQVHMLKVHSPPTVKVSQTQDLLSLAHSDIYLHCHTDGLPQPTIQWQLNGYPIVAERNHHVMIHNNRTLIIHSADFQQDTGAYKCRAKNLAGQSDDVSTIVIVDPKKKHPVFNHRQRGESFYVFHDNGYNVYDPNGCYTQKLVNENFGDLKYIPEELDEAPALCKSKGSCQWGRGVNVRNKYIYISQPEENRVVVIDSAGSKKPVEFIETDKIPVKIHYIYHLDQVWVLCWNSKHDTGSKTIIVIRDASQDIRHSIVHTQPIGYRFDLVQDIFLPPQNDLKHEFKYGYVIHNEQRGLFKLELDSMHYTKAVDLSMFDCVPQHVQFIPIGGHIVVKCLQRTTTGSRTLQILLDYITDIPLANTTMFGTPYVTADSRNIITVDEVSGQVQVAKILDNGDIEKAFEVTTGSAISDLTFFPSDISYGYDVFLTSRDSPEIYSISLNNGKVITIKDVGEPRKVKVSRYSKSTRSIIHGDVFSDYVATPGQSSLIVLNGRFREAHCDFAKLKNPDVVVHNLVTVK